MSSPSNLETLKQRGRASAFATSGTSFAKQTKDKKTVLAPLSAQGALPDTENTLEDRGSLRGRLTVNTALKDASSFIFTQFQNDESRTGIKEELRSEMMRDDGAMTTSRDELDVSFPDSQNSSISPTHSRNTSEITPRSSEVSPTILTAFAATQSDESPHSRGSHNSFRTKILGGDDTKSEPRASESLTREPLVIKAVERAAPPPPAAKRTTSTTTTGAKSGLVSAAAVAALPSMHVVVVPASAPPARSRTRSMDELAELLAESQKLVDSGRRRLEVETRTLAKSSSSYEDKSVFEAVAEFQEESTLRSNSRARKLTSAEKLEEEFSTYLIGKGFQERTVERVNENLTEFDKNLIMEREGAPPEAHKNLFQGWLHRQNGRSMTKLYCSVECGQFKYFNVEADEKPKGMIALSIAESASAIPHEILPLSFVLASGNGKKREETQWACSSGEDCLRWVACITACIMGFPDNAIGSEHHCHELTADMMHGLRTILARRTQQPTSVVPSDKDFQEVVSYDFPAKGSKTTPPHKKGDFGFKDYAPSVFRRLRAHYGISPSEYLLDVSGNLGYLEFLSNAKSGEFSFHSHNRKYLIKTISHNECRGLRNHLSTYYKYMMQNNSTFLNKFCGLHKVKPTFAGFRFCWFLIMTTVFPSELPMHLVFELKGATRHRTGKAHERGQPGTVYKDNDILNQKVTFDVGGLTDPLLAQISKDLKLLESLKVIDYTVVCGVHFYGREDSVKDEKPREMGPHRSALSQYLDEERAARFHASLMRLSATIQDFTPRALYDMTEEDLVLAAGGAEGRNFYNLLHGLPVPALTGRMVPTPPLPLISSESKSELRQELSMLGFELASPSIFASDRGGTTAIIGPNGEKGIMFLGIIDTLIEFSNKKKVESFYKSNILRVDKAAFSTVEPEYYAERLRELMLKVLKSGGKS